MNKGILRSISIATVVLFASIFVFELDAFARAGGGRSSGSRGSRSYSSPSRSYSTPAPSRQQAAPVSPVQPHQPAGGGFLRGLGGGILGGLLGGMLFSSLGSGSGFGNGFGGSGIGLFEIILVLGIGYMIYRMVSKKRREENLSYQTAYKQGEAQTSSQPAFGQPSRADTPDDDGLSHIRGMDPGFDEARFKDNVMDIFFRIQGAWMNRDLSSAAGLFTDEMRTVFQEDIDKMLRDKKIDRLENIAVRNVEITEAWQESGKDFITTLIHANLLDYTTDAVTGELVAGNKTEPVKFEEFWTFTRPVGSGQWRLSAINQV
ncbi:MAG: Tim44 domain-containing protein [Nitrospirota bacterium]